MELFHSCLSDYPNPGQVIDLLFALDEVHIIINPRPHRVAVIRCFVCVYVSFIKISGELTIWGL